MKTKKQSNFSITYSAKVYKEIMLIKMNTSSYVVILLTIRKKHKMNVFFGKLNIKTVLDFFSHNDLKINLEFRA